MFGVEWLVLGILTWGIGHLTVNKAKERLSPMGAATGPAGAAGPVAGAPVDPAERKKVADIIRDWRAKLDDTTTAFDDIKWNEAAWWRRAVTGAIWTTLKDLEAARKKVFSSGDRRAEDGGPEAAATTAPQEQTTEAPKVDEFAGPADEQPEDITHEPTGDDGEQSGGRSGWWGGTTGGQGGSRRASWWRYSPEADPWMQRAEKVVSVDVQPVRPTYPALPKPTPALEAFAPTARETEPEPAPAGPAPQPQPEPRIELGPATTVERVPNPEPVTVNDPELRAAITEAGETIRRVNAPHQEALDRGDRPAFRDSDGNLVWIATQEPRPQQGAAEVVAAPTIPASSQATALVAVPTQAGVATVAEQVNAPAPSKELDTNEREHKPMAGKYVAIPGTQAPARPAGWGSSQVSIAGGDGMDHDQAKELIRKIVYAVGRTGDPARDAVRITRMSAQAAWYNVDGLVRAGIHGPVLRAWGDAAAHLEDAKEAGQIFLLKIQAAMDATAKARRMQVRVGDDIQAAIDRANGSVAASTRYYRFQRRS